MSLPKASTTHTSLFSFFLKDYFKNKHRDQRRTLYVCNFKLFQNLDPPHYLASVKQLLQTNVPWKSDFCNWNLKVMCFEILEYRWLGFVKHI